MTDNVENLILEHPKRFQASLDRIERELREVRTRQNDTHSAVVGIRRDQVQDAEISAHLQVQLDAVKDRLERIERRLEFSTELKPENAVSGMTANAHQQALTFAAWDAMAIRKSAQSTG